MSHSWWRKHAVRKREDERPQHKTKGVMNYSFLRKRPENDSESYNVSANTACWQKKRPWSERQRFCLSKSIKCYIPTIWSWRDHKSSSLSRIFMALNDDTHCASLTFYHPVSFSDSPPPPPLPPPPPAVHETDPQKLDMISIWCVGHDLHTTAPKPLERTCCRQFLAQWGDCKNLELRLSMSSLLLLLLLLLL